MNPLHPSPFTLHPSLLTVMERIHEALRRSGRPPNSVKLIGVTKGQEVEKISAALLAGLRDFGENYVQEWQAKKKQLAAKSSELLGRIRWHFIGHLQSNKATDVAGEVDYLHSLDSLHLAKKISELALRKGRTQKVLLEINVGEEPNKSGFLPSQLRHVLPVCAALPHLSLEGLMCIPPLEKDAAASRPYFKRLKSLLDESNRSGVLKQAMQELSMGMSQDFEVAIEEGATMVRIGTALFGARK